MIFFSRNYSSTQSFLNSTQHFCREFRFGTTPLLYYVVVVYPFSPYFEVFSFLPLKMVSCVTIIASRLVYVPAAKNHISMDHCFPTQNTATDNKENVATCARRVNSSFDVTTQLNPQLPTWRGI